MIVVSWKNVIEILDITPFSKIMLFFGAAEHIFSFLHYRRNMFFVLYFSIVPLRILDRDFSRFRILFSRYVARFKSVRQCLALILYRWTNTLDL